MMEMKEENHVHLNWTPLKFNNVSAELLWFYYL